MSLFPVCTIQALCCFGMDSPIQFGRNLHKYAFLSFVAPFPLNWPLESYGMCLPCKRNLSYFKRCSRSLVPSRLVDLPWNSPWTWVLTAVLVDLGYYWWDPYLLPSDHSVNHSMLQVDLGHWIWILLVGIILLPSYMIQWFIVCCQYPAVFFSPNFGGDEQNQSKFVSS